MVNKNSANLPFNSIGQIVTGSGTGVTSALSTGTDTNVLMADSTQLQGIKWSAITGLSQTYAPVVSGSGSAGTANYFQQNGWYITFGNLVFLTVNLMFDTFTGTGSLQCTAPTTMNALLNTDGGNNCVFDGNISVGRNNLFATINGGTNLILFTGYGNGTTPQGQICVPAATLNFSLIYAM